MRKVQCRLLNIWDTKKGNLSLWGIPTSRKVRGPCNGIAWIMPCAPAARSGNLSKKVHDLPSKTVFGLREAHLLAHILSSSYCTFFKEAGCCVVASMKILRLPKLGDLCCHLVVGGGNVSPSRFLFSFRPRKGTLPRSSYKGGLAFLFNSPPL